MIYDREQKFWSWENGDNQLIKYKHIQLDKTNIYSHDAHGVQNGILDMVGRWSTYFLNNFCDVITYKNAC